MVEMCRIQHGLVWWIRDRKNPAGRPSLAICCSSETDDIWPNADSNLKKICAKLNLGEKPERWEQNLEHGCAATILRLDQQIQGVDLNRNHITTYTLSGHVGLGFGKTAKQCELAAILALSFTLIVCATVDDETLPEELCGLRPILMSSALATISGTFNWHREALTDSAANLKPRGRSRSPARDSKRSTPDSYIFTYKEAQEIKSAGSAPVSYRQVLDYLKKQSERHRREMKSEVPQTDFYESDITINDFPWQSFIAHIRDEKFVKTLLGPGISSFMVGSRYMKCSDSRLLETYFLVERIDGRRFKLLLKADQGVLVARLQSITDSTRSNTYTLPQRDDVFQAVTFHCEHFMKTYEGPAAGIQVTDLASKFVRSVGFKTLQLNVQPLADGKSFELCSKYRNRLEDFLYTIVRKHAH